MCLCSATRNIRFEAKSPSFFDHFVLSFDQSFLHNVICPLKENGSLYQKICFLFPSFDIVRSIKWKVEEKNDRRRQLLSAYVWDFLYELIHHSKEDDLLYKNVCWLFSFILIFVIFQSIKVVECPEDIHYFYQQLLLLGYCFRFLFFLLSAKLDKNRHKEINVSHTLIEQNILFWKVYDSVQ